MVQYKLVYFNVRGIAEGARLLLHYVGQEFEDVRHTIDEFPKIKPGLKYGQLPYLEVDGKKLYQSATINRYLGEKFNLAGHDDWERAQVNELVDFLKDIYSNLAPYFYVLSGFRQGDKDKLREEVFIPNSTRLLPLLDKVLSESPSGFSVASGITFVDFMIVDVIDAWAAREPSLTENYPAVRALIKKVYGLPQLQSYLDNRN